MSRVVLPFTCALRCMLRKLITPVQVVTLIAPIVSVVVRLVDVLAPIVVLTVPVLVVATVVVVLVVDLDIAVAPVVAAPVVTGCRTRSVG